MAADTGIGKSPLLYHLMACCTALKPFAPNVPVTLDMPLKVLLFKGEGSLRLDVEPLLIVVLGGSVGTMVIALYMPMFNVIKLIK